MGEKASAAAATEKVISEGEELPKAIVRRVVKDKLSQLSSSNDDVSVYREALLAFSESTRIFIHYLSATANDICKESKRQTINVDDVFKALEEIEFTEFIEPLKASLAEFKRKNAGKKTASKVKEGNEEHEETPMENGGEEVEVEDKDDKMDEDDDISEKMNEDDDHNGKNNDTPDDNDQ